MTRGEQSNLVLWILTCSIILSHLDHHTDAGCDTVLNGQDLWLNPTQEIITSLFLSSNGLRACQYQRDSVCVPLSGKTTTEYCSSSYLLSLLRTHSTRSYNLSLFVPSLSLNARHTTADPSIIERKPKTAPHFNATSSISNRYLVTLLVRGCGCFQDAGK